jgi:hypothetical protein
MTTAGAQQPSRGHGQASPVPRDVVAYLEARLGRDAVAYIAGITDRRQVRHWQREDGPAPRRMADARLRTAYEAVTVLERAAGAPAAKAWLFGRNARLGGAAPACALRAARSAAELRRIASAAGDPS